MVFIHALSCYFLLLKAWPSFSGHIRTNLNTGFPSLNGSGYWHIALECFEQDIQKNKMVDYCLCCKRLYWASCLLTFFGLLLFSFLFSLLLSLLGHIGSPPPALRAKILYIYI
jgi:hypothetical protein